MSYIHQLAALLFRVSVDPHVVAPEAAAAVREHLQAGSWEFALPDGSFPTPVGAAIAKLDSSGVTTGEAEFVDDIPSPPNCKVRSTCSSELFWFLFAVEEIHFTDELVHAARGVRALNPTERLDYKR